MLVISHTYQLLHHKRHIHKIYNHTTIKIRQKNTVNKVKKIDLHTITNCTTSYHTYFLLYYKGHINITHNHTTIKEKQEQYSKQSKKY